MDGEASWEATKKVMWDGKMFLRTKFIKISKFGLNHALFFIERTSQLIEFRPVNESVMMIWTTMWQV